MSRSHEPKIAEEFPVAFNPVALVAAVAALENASAVAPVAPEERSRREDLQHDEPGVRARRARASTRSRPDESTILTIVVRSFALTTALCLG